MNKVCKLKPIQKDFSECKSDAYSVSTSELGSTRGYVFEKERIQSRQREAVKELKETRRMLDLA